MHYPHTKRQKHQYENTLCTKHKILSETRLVCIPCIAILHPEDMSHTKMLLKVYDKFHLSRINNSCVTNCFFLYKCLI